MKEAVGPIDIDNVPWQALGEHGLKRKVLSHDPDTGAVTQYVHIPPNWRGGGVAHYHSCFEEVFIIQGDVTLNGGRDRLLDGSYLYRPAHIVHGHDESAEKGCMCIIRMGAEMDFNLVQEPESDQEYPLYPVTDPRSHVLHLKTPDMDWVEHGDEGNRYRFKLLSMDPETKAYTALIALEPGWSGWLSTEREYGREWFVLSGSQQRDDGATFGANTYYYAPPGKKHAAMTGSKDGCVMLTWMHAES